MGYAKQRMLEEQEQGWTFLDSKLAVCAKCFEDYGIKEFIRDNASAQKCSYCKRRSKRPIAAPMNDVLGLIGDGLHSNTPTRSRRMPAEMPCGRWLRSYQGR